ncbi:ACT domain-containing protein [Pseudonocardia asaccharolytica]|uniref:ACT domain-containing protein n=1 Tax=Pseudonocardia asaccharolytica TaxID=54010 RepID=UPI00040AA9B5|nr:ACT domain-containing protein [Pseudonocardia asaccharolytica]
MSFLLRVVLPDRPGSLGAVATALGNAGADILGVDVVERSAGTAVDDLAVELPAGRPPDVLITAAEAVPGVQVESVRPYVGRLDTHRELELVDEIAGDPAHGLQRLTDEVPRLFRAGWALIVVREGGRSWRLAESGAAPETRAGDLPWLPLTTTMVIDPETQWVPSPWRELDTELAAAPFGPASSAQALVVGRPGGPAFRRSELARLTHLAGIVTAVLGPEGTSAGG